MNRARDHLFAGAGLAKDQHVAVKRGNLANQVIDVADKRRVTSRQNGRTRPRYRMQIACADINESPGKGGSFSHGFVIPFRNLSGTD